MKGKILFLTIIWFCFAGVCGVAAQRPKGKAQPSQRQATPPSGTGQRSTVRVPLARYFPIAKGARWKYHVVFPASARLPYYPDFEKPEGLVSADGITGMGSWDQGTVDFEILVEDVIEKSSNSSTWKALLGESANRFLFFIELKDPSRGRHQIRLKTEKEDTSLDIKFLIGGEADPDMILVRTIAKLSAAGLAQKNEISVAGGHFKNCVKSVLTINTGQGQYPVEAFLAPDVGVVKAIGKSPQGEVLYTLELTEFVPGQP
jgi:hypothetical protein